MIDINFYRNIYKLKRSIMDGEKFDIDYVKSQFEQYRSEFPVIYNIETTNACNMTCKMCPRTTMMTRKIMSLDINIIDKIISQLRPWTQPEWNEWKKFVEKTYHIYEDNMSENHFFLYIIPKVIQLHGFGDPLLDKNIEKWVRSFSNKNFYTYFSCNPANINIDKTEKIFDAGLSYIKYSIESVDDLRHKEIRGFKSDFKKSYDKIIKVLDIKEKNNYNVTVIITMLDLNNDKQKEEYDALEKAFKDLDVYIYLKSQDQQWYNTKEYHGTNSVHWSEICQHPWMTMTIKSNAEVVMCMEDFNNEIILGNVIENSLYDIWNGEKYRKFREDHFTLFPDLKCTKECDMKLIGDYF